MMATSPSTEPATAPAMAPGEILVEPWPVKCKDDPTVNELVLVKEERGKGDKQPNRDAVGANPSIGCA